MNLKLAKFLSSASRGVFLYAPSLYFQIYSLYKRKADSYKLELLKKHVNSGGVVLDIGAHIGYYTRLLAKLVGPSGTVHAFEPSPENFYLLEKNCKNIANARLHNQAVGDKASEIKLYVSPDLNVDHHTYPSAEARASVSVKQIALDDLLAGEARICFIKMDIQGYEYQALSGMSGILKRDRPVIISELWPWGLRNAGHSAEESLVLLQSLGYKVLLLDESKRSAIPISLDFLKTGEADYYDILCLPK